MRNVVSSDCLPARRSAWRSPSGRSKASVSVSRAARSIESATLVRSSRSRAASGARQSPSGPVQDRGAVSDVARTNRPSSAPPRPA